MVRGEDQSCNVPYYGQLTDIVELQYTEGNKVEIGRASCRERV